MVHGHPRENPTEDPKKPRRAQQSQPRPTKMPSKAHPEMAGDGGPGVEARPPTRQSSKQQKPKTRTPTGQQDANSSGQQPKPRKSRKKRPAPVADPPPSTGSPPPVIRNRHTIVNTHSLSQGSSFQNAQFRFTRSRLQWGNGPTGFLCCKSVADLIYKFWGFWLQPP